MVIFHEKAWQFFTETVELLWKLYDFHKSRFMLLIFLPSTKREGKMKSVIIDQ